MRPPDSWPTAVLIGSFSPSENCADVGDGKVGAISDCRPARADTCDVPAALPQKPVVVSAVQRLNDNNGRGHGVGVLGAQDHERVVDHLSPSPVVQRGPDELREGAAVR